MGTKDECVCVCVQIGGEEQQVNIVRPMERNKGFQKIDLSVSDLHQRGFML